MPVLSQEHRHTISYFNALFCIDLVFEEFNVDGRSLILVCVVQFIKYFVYLVAIYNENKSVYDLGHYFHLWKSLCGFQR